MTRIGIVEDDRGLAPLMTQLLRSNGFYVEEPIDNLAQVPLLCKQLREGASPQEQIVLVVDGTFINQGTLDSDAGVKAAATIRRELPHALIIRFSTEDVRREEDKESYDFFIPKTGATESVHGLVAHIKAITP